MNRRTGSKRGRGANVEDTTEEDKENQKQQKQKERK